MPDRIAVINAGSSSVKFALFDPADPAGHLLRGQIEAISAAAHLSARDGQGGSLADRRWPEGALDRDAALREILDLMDEVGGGAPAAIGHRVVHGGRRFTAPVRVDQAVLAELDALVPMAPLHQPHNLAPIRAAAAHRPGVAQVACFDTAFHHGQPEVARRLALPRRFAEDGVERYGFHGLSYEYLVGAMRARAPDLAERRLIVAHLGNGASLCAIERGRSVATTMGFTPADGLVMGTRCGVLDPGVIPFLMRRYALDVDAIDDLIERQSGLLGVSGVSPDMRKLRDSPEPAAAEAIALFEYRIVREIGSMAAALGGVDALVFSGGIGEHDAATRAAVTRRCAWLGFTLDEARNQAGEGRISADGSQAAAWMVPTDEERMIARHTEAVLDATP